MIAMTLFNKLSTILGWTFLGGLSAYITAAIITFSQIYGVLFIMNLPISGWNVVLLISGIGTGFFVGMVKACVIDVIDVTRRM